MKEELITNCTMCNETLGNGTTLPLMTHYLSEAQIIYNLNSTLWLMPAYAYIVWYIIGIPANFIAFAVWIQRKVGWCVRQSRNYGMGI